MQFLINKKYEIDSLCGFLKLSRSYYQETNDASIMNTECSFILFYCSFTKHWRIIYSQGFDAINQIFLVIEEQSQASFDADFNFISYYNWTGTAGSLSPAVNNGGNGEPKGYTGLVGTHHRPSDDLSTFGA